jgi:hypothetical protein
MKIGTFVAALAPLALAALNSACTQEPSKAAKAATSHLLANRPGFEAKVFCGDYLTFKYNNSTAFGDQNVIREAKYYQYLKQNGYVTELPDTWSPKGLAGLSSIAGMVEYRFAPTPKFLDLMDGRDSQGCYLHNAVVFSNVVIKNEIVHPQYKTVTTVYLEYDQQPSKYYELWLPHHGFPGSGKVMRRTLVIEHPVTHAMQVRRVDIGFYGGAWARETVPEALTLINAAGPDALK